MFESLYMTPQIKESTSPTERGSEKEPNISTKESFGGTGVVKLTLTVIPLKLSSSY